MSRLGLAFVFASAACLAQEESGAVFRSDTRLVLLHATVVDREGRLLTALPKTAFRVYEDGVEQQLKVFRREDVPVSMGLIVDNSGSMKGKRAKVEAAAIELVKASNPDDEVFIVNFNDTVYHDVPFTSSLPKLQEGIARIDSRGGTAMRDAIQLALDYARQKGRHDKKALVVITDGNDNMSEVTIERLLLEAQRREVLIYAIGLLADEERREAREAEKVLEMITRATGGKAFYPMQVDEVHRIALQVARDIRNQYILAYSPANEALDGSFRRIRVAVAGPNRPSARTRTGYYATPELAGKTGAR